MTINHPNIEISADNFKWNNKKKKEKYNNPRSSLYSPHSFLVFFTAQFSRLFNSISLLFPVTLNSGVTRFLTLRLLPAATDTWGYVLQVSRGLCLAVAFRVAARAGCHQQSLHGNNVRVITRPGHYFAGLFLFHFLPLSVYLSEYLSASLFVCLSMFIYLLFYPRTYFFCFVLQQGRQLNAPPSKNKMKNRITRCYYTHLRINL